MDVGISMLRSLLMVLAITSLFASFTARAVLHTYNVNNEADLITAIAGINSLSDPDTAQVTFFTPSITLTASLPVIHSNLSSPVTIQGNGATINGNYSYEGFFLNAGSFVINNLRFTQCSAVGGLGGSNGGAGGGGLGAGGALYVRSGVTANLFEFVFTSNQAIGGIGGAGSSTANSGGGGGGGLNGNSGGLVGGNGGTGVTTLSTASSGDGASGLWGGGGGGSSRPSDPVTPVGLRIGGAAGYRPAIGGTGGGTGGFGAGGGGGANTLAPNAGTGGFGAGGGGTGVSGGLVSVAAGGFGGGSGGGGGNPSSAGGGGGGAGLGGAFFAEDGSTVSFSFSTSPPTWQFNSVSPGSAGASAGGAAAVSGSAYGNGLFIHSSGVTRNIPFVMGATYMTVTISDSIADVAGSGGDINSKGSLSVQTGKLVLGGVNTYTGGTTVDGGTLAVSLANQYGSGDITLLNGGTFQANGGFTLANEVVLSTAGGKIDVTNVAYVLDITSDISGSTTLTKTGPGSITMTGAKTYSGTTVIEAGLVQYSIDTELGSGSVTLKGGGLQAGASFTSNKSMTLDAGGGTIDTNGFDLTFTGTISETSSLSLTKMGGGILIMSGSKSYSGGTILSGGTLQYGDDSELGTGGITLGPGTLQANTSFDTTKVISSNPGMGLIDANGYVFTLSGDITGSQAVFFYSTAGKTVLNGNKSWSGGVNLTGGTLEINSTSSCGGGTLYLNGTTTLLAGNDVTFANNVSLGGTVNIDTQGYNLQTNGILTSSSASIQKKGTGTFVLTQDSTGTSTDLNFNIENGLLRYSHDNQLGGGTVSITLSGGGIQSASTFTSSKTLTLLSPNSGRIDVSGSAQFTYSGQIIQSGGACTLEKTGSGYLFLGYLSGNTYTGGTLISGGYINYTQDNQLGSGNITLDGGGLVILSNFSTNKKITLTGPGTIIVGSNNVYTLSNVSANTLTGSGLLTKTGSGTLVITQSNNYSGGTSLTGGFIEFNNLSGLGTGSISLNSSGLRINATMNPYANTIILAAGASTLDTNSFNWTISNPITGSGSLIKESTGILTMTANYTGITLVNAGAVNMGGTAVAGDLILSDATVTFTSANVLAATKTITMNQAGSVLNLGGNNQLIASLSGIGTVQLGGAQLTVDSTTDATYSGSIQGAGTLIKDGSNVVTLLGTNSYVGPTTVNLGGLTGTTNSLVTDITNHTLVTFNQAFTGIYNKVISSTGQVVKTGLGNTILTGIHTYTGDTVINQGRLTVNGAITGTVTVNAGGILGGIGTINNATVTNYGSVSPGNSIGVLTIDGDYLSGPDGNLVIELNDAGQCSQLVVTGTAQLDGTLTIMPQPGNYSVGQVFYIINDPLSSGTVTGTFDSINPDPYGIFDPELFYYPHYVELEVAYLREPLAPRVNPNDTNAHALAVYLDSIPKQSARTELMRILGIMSQEMTDAQLTEALEIINPGKLTMADQQIQQNGVLINYLNSIRLETLRLEDWQEENNSIYFSGGRLDQQISLRSDTMESKEYHSTKNALGAQASRYHPYMFRKGNPNAHIWAQAFGVKGAQKARYEDPAFRSKSTGILAGMDYTPYPGVFGGIGFGHYETRVQLNDRQTHVNLTNNFLTTYGTWYRGGLYAELSFMAGVINYRTEQHIFFNVFNYTAKGGHRGFQLAPHIGIGYIFDFHWAKLVPYASFDYSYVRQQPYLLARANALSIQTRTKTASVFRQEYGLKAAKTFTLDTTKITPDIIFSFSNQKPLKANTMAGLVDHPQVFNVQNFSHPVHTWSTSLGITVETPMGTFATVRGDTEFGSGYVGYEVSLRLGLAF